MTKMYVCLYVHIIGRAIIAKSILDKIAKSGQGPGNLGSLGGEEMKTICTEYI